MESLIGAEQVVKICGQLKTSKRTICLSFSNFRESFVLVLFVELDLSDIIGVSE